jgi:hypothetical protein
MICTVIFKLAKCNFLLELANSISPSESVNQENMLSYAQHGSRLTRVRLVPVAGGSAHPLGAIAALDEVAT